MCVRAWCVRVCVSVLNENKRNTTDEYPRVTRTLIHVRKVVLEKYNYSICRLQRVSKSRFRKETISNIVLLL